MNAAELRGVSYVYSEHTPFCKVAVDQINITFEEKIITGIIGHTGSGKSTVSQLLNGLVKMFSVGQVSWNAVDIFSAISPLKILIIAIIAIIIYLPTLKISKNICQKMSPRINSAAEITYTVLVFGLFAISVIYFLPQFPQYAASAFSNVVI